MWRLVSQYLCMLFLLLLLGCKGIFGPHGLPPDPLFATRKPIESKTKTGPPAAEGFGLPVVPGNPYFAEQRSATVPVLRTDSPSLPSGR